MHHTRHSHSKPVIALLVLALAAMSVALSACRAELNVTINEEEVGEIEVVGAVSNTILSLLQLGGDDPFEDLLEIPDADADASGFGIGGVRIEEYSDGSFTGVRLAATFDPYDPTFAAISDDDSMLGTLMDEFGIGDFRFSRTNADDGWIVELNQNTDLSFMDGIDDLTGDIPFNVGDLDLPFVISLTLPGRYVEHNADREVDGTLVWDTNLRDGVNISVVSRDPGIALTPIIISAIFASIFGGIVIYVIVSRERRRRREEEDAAQEALEHKEASAST